MQLAVRLARFISVLCAESEEARKAPKTSACAAADIDVAEVSVFDDNVNDDGDDLIVEQIDSKEVECLPASLGTTIKAGAKNRSEGNMNFLLTFFFLLLRHYSYSNI